ncbi:MAG TPA: type IV secretion system DNA-binding domain-containing protein [Blastocatellia bacterium]|nr:type IV secretion system DNA-binding domain-containing protein [Blastocatellia bacterium]
MTTSLPPDNEISFIGRTSFRNEHVSFGIRQADRRAPVYIIGRTGTGKSTLLEHLIRQDLVAGRGLMLLDPHGDLVERVLAHVPETRQTDLIYFNVSDYEHPLAFNPLEPVSPARRSLAASGLLEVFRKNWPESWGPRLEHVLRHALLALFEQKEATLVDVLRLLDDRGFRRRVAGETENVQVREFWLGEYERYPERFRVEVIAPVQNKVGAFLADPLLCRILVRPRSAFRLRRVMDEGKILLVNLAKGRIGGDTAALLGSLLLARAGLAALSRADVPEEERRDFHVYADEFQNFTTLSLATMLSESRKYRLNLTLAHQYLSQLDPQVRDALLGNAGTIISFRLGVADAELLAGEFAPVFTAADLVGLPNYSICVKLMIDGAVSPPFSAETLPSSA